jgi:hypothetical protein
VEEELRVLKKQLAKRRKEEAAAVAKTRQAAFEESIQEPIYAAPIYAHTLTYADVCC